MLYLWIERVGVSYDRLRANGQDSALVGISVLDDKGAVVTPSHIVLNFNITGPAVIYGTGNGV